MQQNPLIGNHPYFARVRSDSVGYGLLLVLAVPLRDHRQYIIGDTMKGPPRGKQYHIYSTIRLVAQWIVTINNVNSNQCRWDGRGGMDGMERRCGALCTAQVIFVPQQLLSVDTTETAIKNDG